MTTPTAKASFRAHLSPFDTALNAIRVNNDCTYCIGVPDHRDAEALYCLLHAAISLCGVRRQEAIMLTRRALAEMTKGDVA